MEKHSIIWDFDGTILPNVPFDSEQSLLMFIANHPDYKFGKIKRFIAKVVVYADRKAWFVGSFKRNYIQILKGTRTEILDHIAEVLAERISGEDRRTYHRLKESGHDMLVVSCGTADLSVRVLKAAGIDGCFRLIEGNRFRIADGCIIGMDFSIYSPEDKIKILDREGVSLKDSVVIGDGPTDIPLLARAALPILIDRTGSGKYLTTVPQMHHIASISEIENLITDRSIYSEKDKRR